jgi:hypothetical protein
MPSGARAALMVVALVSVACARPPASAPPSPSPGPPLTVAGWITEIEFGTLSLRTTDGRSLIFTLERPPLSVDRLREDMAEQSPIRVTYRAVSGKLVPLRIEEPCPGPDCPHPYTQPPPFTPPSPTG